MSEPLRIELPWRSDSADLAEALRTRGLNAEVIEDGEECTLEVSYATDERERLFGDVSTTVESWANDRGTPLILTRLDDRCALRPPSD